MAQTRGSASSLSIRKSNDGCAAALAKGGEQTMADFEILELTAEELSAIPDFIGELALGCGYLLCGACGNPT